MRGGKIVRHRDLVLRCLVRYRGRYDVIGSVDLDAIAYAWIWGFCRCARASGGDRVPVASASVTQTLDFGVRSFLVTWASERL